MRERGRAWTRGARARARIMHADRRKNRVANTGSALLYYFTPNRGAFHTPEPEGGVVVSGVCGFDRLQNFSGVYARAGIYSGAVHLS